jgi:hypothetical protein
MLADESFCQSPNNGERQGIPLLRVRLTNMPMFSDRVSISGIRLLHNECSDEAWERTRALL